jgi:HrpA-like RNA helicase
LKKKFNRIAFPITATQTPKEQKQYLATGQIFISTAIAETSLTFRKLKYVIDSRLSRWRTFDSELELMKTEEDYSSNSSIKQRRGRVGRTCNG